MSDKKFVTKKFKINKFKINKFTTNETAIDRHILNNIILNKKQKYNNDYQNNLINYAAYVGSISIGIILILKELSLPGSHLIVMGLLGIGSNLITYLNNN